MSGGVGLTYEGEPDNEWDRAPLCTVHGGYEMFHTCAGGPGEPLGYCAKAPSVNDCNFITSTQETDPDE